MFHRDTEVIESDDFEDNSLFGYSVTSGNFLELNKTHYAAGGPRAANSFGKASYDSLVLLSSNYIFPYYPSPFSNFGGTGGAADVVPARSTTAGVNL